MFDWVGEVAARGGRALGFVRHRAGGLALLPTVLLAVAGGVLLVVVAELVLDRVVHVKAEAAAPIDITKLAFAAVAGVGGVVGLVVAYRRQRDIEQGRFVERFGAAAAQLGASDVAVRIAGVYAMAGVADETTPLRRQQCIDVLCGYLRLPYTPELGDNHQTKHIRKHVGAYGAPDTEDTFEYRQNDKEVRQTILRVIYEHLRYRYTHNSWQAHDFDFRTAHLEDVEFGGAVFRGRVEFEKATFSGGAGFRYADFSHGSSFAGTTFFGPADFFGAKLFWETTFDGATFSGPANFEGVTLFGEAKFRDVDFGTKTISFDHPRTWGPRLPEFDWDDDLSKKPVNVTPQDWPPKPQIAW